jgi:hypothetical protein
MLTWDTVLVLCDTVHVIWDTVSVLWDTVHVPWDTVPVRLAYAYIYHDMFASAVFMIYIFLVT